MKVFFGASGFAKELFLLYKRQQKKINEPYDDIDYFVISDHEVVNLTHFKAVRVIREADFFKKYVGVNLIAYIAIGSPSVRHKLINKILSWNSSVIFPNIIDPSAIVDIDEGNIFLGKGIVICAGCILTSDITINDFVHINLDCTIGHDVKIDSFTTISPGCHVSGNVNIGKGVFCGTSAVILEEISIESGVKLGAATVVINNILEKGTYVGIPAKKIK